MKLLKVLPVILLAMILTAMPSQAQSGHGVTGSEVANLLNKVDTVLIPVLVDEITKQKNLGIGVQGPEVVLHHIQEASGVIRKKQAFSPFLLYVLSSNINAAWFNFVIDADRLKDTDKQAAQNVLDEAHAVVEPIANKASFLTYRLLSSSNAVTTPNGTVEF
jgi:hypothetical protein